MAVSWEPCANALEATRRAPIRCGHRTGGGRRWRARRIGQEDLIARAEAPAASSLAQLTTLLDWAEVDRAPSRASRPRQGELGWPPLALFRGLLPATWHDLPEVWRVRRRIEKAFGTCGRLGPAKAGLQVRLAAMAYSLRRTVTLLNSAVA